MRGVAPPFRFRLIAALFLVLLWAACLDQASGPAGPATFDEGSSPADDIGTLSAFETIVFDTCNDNPNNRNIMDAAIALTSDLDNVTPSAGYGMPKSATIVAALDMKVKKFGRTTGQTKGQVAAINATVTVSDDDNGVDRVACFTDQIVITPGTFSAPGDSGALVVVDGKGRLRPVDRRPVGLLFAGSFFTPIISPIDEILTEFDVTIDGEGDPDP